MNDLNLEYKNLLANYRELQLRVTRFSAVEQELINTRDRLDAEVVLYKKLNDFNRNALKDLSERRFLQLLSETVVDIFELESAVIFLIDLQNIEKSHFFTEGVSISEEQKTLLAEDFVNMGKSLQNGRAYILYSEQLSSYQAFNAYSKILFSHFTDKELNFQIFISGLISKEFEPIYREFDSRHETIFNVFSHQVHSLLANIRRNYKIKDQVSKISQSESELRKLSQIAIKTKNGVIISDLEGRIVWVNDAFETITGYNNKEVIGRKPKDFLQGKETDAQTVQLMKTALERKEYVEVIVINYKKNGEKYFNSLQISPIFDENGKHQSFIALQRDITSEILSKNELLNVNARFELIAEKSQIGIWESNFSNGKSVWNKILIEQYGADVDLLEKELISHLKFYLHPEDLSRISEKMNHFIQSENDIFEDEYRIIHGKTKEIISIKALVIAERDSNKKLIKLIGTNIDVTEKKKHEQSLKIHLEQQVFLAEISLELNHLNIIGQRIDLILNKLIRHTNVSRVYIFENTEIDNVCVKTYEVSNDSINYQLDEMENLSYSNLPYLRNILLEKGYLFSDNIQALPDEIRLFLTSKNLHSIIIYPLIVKGGFFGFIGFEESNCDRKWSKSELEMLRAVSGIISNAFERDISEKNLLASENKYRSIIDNMNLGLVETDLEGNTIYSNKKFYELTLLDDPTVLIVNHDELFKQRLKSKVISSYNKLDENSFEIGFKRKDGVKKTFLISYANAYDQMGKISGQISVILDISKVKNLQKNLESALKDRDTILLKSTRLKNFYENVLNNQPSEVIVLNPEMRITYSNQHFHRKESIWIDAIDKSIYQLLNTEKVNSDIIKNLITKIEEAVSSKKLVQFEENYSQEDGSDSFTLKSILPVTDTKNNLENIIITGIDITKIKIIEKRILKKNDELKKINSELDNFVYSVSHDLRSPLLSVKGILSIIFKTTELDEKVVNYLKMAEKSILRLDGTIQEILDYSRNARLGLEFEEIDLREMVNAIYDDIKFYNTHPVEFKMKIDIPDKFVTDKSRLNTVLKNVLGNAFKYLRKTNDSFVSFNATEEKEYLILKISDNGEGIATEHLNKIFDMFYRATNSSSGTGLGLYICKEILNKMNGEIQISSVINEGTSVFIKIPRSYKNS